MWTFLFLSKEGFPKKHFKGFMSILQTVYVSLCVHTQSVCVYTMKCLLPVSKIHFTVSLVWKQTKTDWREAVGAKEIMCRAFSHFTRVPSQKRETELRGCLTWVLGNSVSVLENCVGFHESWQQFYFPGCGIFAAYIGGLIIWLQNIKKTK